MTVMTTKTSKPNKLNHEGAAEIPLDSEITMETCVLNDEESQDSSEDDLFVLVPPVERPANDDVGWISIVKNIFSAALLVFCLILLSAAIFTKQTRATMDVGLMPGIAYALMGCALLWLAIIEGGLNSLVGLRHLDKERYKDSHPLAYRATILCQKGNYLERFIVGRQYMDLTMVFTISFLATATKGATVLGLPSTVCTVFLGTGLAVTLVTIVLGQLVLQINAAHCMLDYMNSYAMLGSTYLALAVETTGVCHVVYLVQRLASRSKRKTAHAATSSTTNNTATSTSSSFSSSSSWQTFAFWIRVLLSAALLCFALVTVAVATFRGQTKVWDGVPPWASVLVFVFLALFVGMMDGLQIALVAVVHLPASQIQHRPKAWANATYVVKGQRLPSFLLGRQIGQTVVQFVLARLLTLDVPVGTGNNIWGVSDFWQKVFNSGGLGAIITTVLASLCWRVLASEFPLMFLSSPFARPIIALCLFAERTGIINIAWSLAALHRKVMGLHPDEYYLGGSSPNNKEHGKNLEDHDITLPSCCDKEESTTGSTNNENGMNHLGPQEDHDSTPPCHDMEECRTTPSSEPMEDSTATPPAAAAAANAREDKDDERVSIKDCRHVDSQQLPF